MLDTTTQLLVARWKSHKRLPSDYAAAKALHVTPATLSNWKRGVSHAQADLAAKMAEECGLDVIRVLAAIEADRAKAGPVQRVWKRLGAGAFGALAVAALWLGSAIQTQSMALDPSEISMSSDINTHSTPSRNWPYAHHRLTRQGVLRVFCWAICALHLVALMASAPSTIRFRSASRAQPLTGSH